MDTVLSIVVYFVGNGNLISLNVGTNRLKANSGSDIRMQGGNQESCSKTHEHHPAGFIEFAKEVARRHLLLYRVCEKGVKRMDGYHLSVSVKFYFIVRFNYCH
ncbi:hypothetical protein ACMYSN_02625 [Klebsiella sp. R445]